MADLNINYLQQLDDVRNNLAGSHKLLRDLDFNSNDSYDQDDVDWETKKTAWTTGTGWTPLGEFDGIFNGGNYSISNLFIDRDATDFVGLFMYGGGEIKNLQILNANITGYSSVGICVGSFWGTITNIKTSGVANGNSQIGGVIGYGEDGTISKSFSSANINSNDYSGGFIGLCECSVSNCYSTGIITRLSGEDIRIAGFCGSNSQGSITKSYSTGSVHYTGTDDPTDKGFVGAQTTGGAFEDADNFFDSTTSGQATTTGNATAKTTAQMKDIATFSDITTTKRLKGATGTYSGTNGLYQPDGTHDEQTRWKHKTEDYWILYNSGGNQTHVGNKRNYADAGFVEIYTRLGTSVEGAYANTNGTGDVSVADETLTESWDISQRKFKGKTIWNIYNDYPKLNWESPNSPLPTFFR